MYRNTPQRAVYDRVHLGECAQIINETSRELTELNLGAPTHKGVLIRAAVFRFQQSIRADLERLAGLEPGSYEALTMREELKQEMERANDFGEGVRK